MTELGDRRPGGHERLLSRECAGCGTTITYGGVGRRPRYCGAACRQRAWALRAAERRLGTPADPRPAVVREVVEVRVAPPPLTKVYLEAKEAAERAEAAAGPRVPNTGRDWALLLGVLTDQLTDDAHPLAREHWHHERLHTALMTALAALDGAHPGGLAQLRNRRHR